MVAKEDIPFKRKHSMKKGKKWEDIFDRGTARMARIVNGKLYTLLDKIKIPREKVRVTEYVKQARK